VRLFPGKFVWIYSPIPDFFVTCDGSGGYPSSTPVGARETRAMSVVRDIFVFFGSAVIGATAIWLAFAAVRDSHVERRPVRRRPF
jgi:hypothetical protein